MSFLRYDRGDPRPGRRVPEAVPVEAPAAAPADGLLALQASVARKSTARAILLLLASAIGSVIGAKMLLQ